MLGRYTHPSCCSTAGATTPPPSPTSTPSVPSPSPPRRPPPAAPPPYKHAIGPISEHHRVFAPDWPGYGQSDKPKMEYSTEYYVGFFERLMDALGLEKANLVGISMGGAVSLGFSLRSPQRVDRK